MIAIDQDSSKPPFEQICDQIAGQIHSGDLSVGERLPSVRAMAAQLGIAPGTVAKAYTHLEQSGLVEGRGRSGTHVSAGQDSARGYAARAAADFAGQVRTLGLDIDELLSIVRAALARTR
ncbi:GntR family transcriptional regulator [Leekyejoonella antrihumi]|uniref:GntR family transcriptional regulator n=1 Tax=Leekyejoonella antrihumi TaxID=1660198 RepID=A0A563DUL9_9MICO|nr:GntR family transcriptional regulator [Leekyejoonella antrihumi]TWP33623.1 GntR family transcriptional regulator [Leekyejoonella antrihumi]